jgi:hypothetical protein
VTPVERWALIVSASVSALALGLSIAALVLLLGGAR